MEIRMRANLHKVFLGIFAGAALAVAGCGEEVGGHTYQNETGMVKIDFQTGGKANLSLGSYKTACTYVEDRKTVTLICEGDKTVFAISSDGKLIPPPEKGKTIGPLSKR